MIVSMIMNKKYIRLKKDYAEKFSEATGIEIQIKNWAGNRKLSMEDISVEYFTNIIDPGSNEKSDFNSFISDDNGQDACDSHAYMFHLLHF